METINLPQDQVVPVVAELVNKIDIQRKECKPSKEEQLVSQNRQLKSRIHQFRIDNTTLKSSLTVELELSLQLILQLNSEKVSFLLGSKGRLLLPHPHIYVPGLPPGPRTVFNWSSFRRYFTESILKADNMVPSTAFAILIASIDGPTLKATIPCLVEKVATCSTNSDLLYALKRLTKYYARLSTQKAALRVRLEGIPSINGTVAHDYTQWRRLVTETLQLYLFLVSDMVSGWSPPEEQRKLKAAVFHQLKGKLPLPLQWQLQMQSEPAGARLTPRRRFDSSPGSSFLTLLTLLDGQIVRAVYYYYHRYGLLPLTGCLFCGETFGWNATDGEKLHFHFPLQCPLRGDGRREAAEKTFNACRRCLKGLNEELVTRQVHEEACQERCDVCFGVHHLALCPIAFPSQKEPAKGCTAEEGQKIAEGIAEEVAPDVCPYGGAAMQLTHASSTPSPLEVPYFIRPYSNWYSTLNNSNVYSYVYYYNTGFYSNAY